MGPFPSSGPEEYKYIFTAKDSASKYVTIRPLRSKEAVEVSTEMLKSVFLVFGFPSKIVTDQGTEFVNKLNEAIFDRLAIEHRPTAPYHPASNGQVERCHREINAMLRALCSPYQHDWAEMLPFVESAINTAQTSTTLMSPFFLVFGRHPFTSLDVRLDLPFPKTEPLASHLGRLLRARELAASRDGRARRVDQAVRPKRAEALKAGDFVLARFSGTGEGRSSKLSPLYQGPFEVLSVRNGNTAVLANVRNPTDRIERHFERLVRFRGSLGEAEGQDEWEISAILDEAVDSGETLFLVRWRGLSPGSDSWVRECDLFADELLREWRVSHPAKAGKCQHPSRSKRRKLKAKETIVVERVISHRGLGKDVMFQVASGEDCGPNDYVWVREEQVSNPEMLVAYLQASTKPERQAGEV